MCAIFFFSWKVKRKQKPTINIMSSKADDQFHFYFVKFYFYSSYFFWDLHNKRHAACGKCAETFAVLQLTKAQRPSIRLIAGVRNYKKSNNKKKIIKAKYKNTKTQKKQKTWKTAKHKLQLTAVRVREGGVSWGAGNAAQQEPERKWACKLPRLWLRLRLGTQRAKNRFSAADAKGRRSANPAPRAPSSCTLLGSTSSAMPSHSLAGDTSFSIVFVVVGAARRRSFVDSAGEEQDETKRNGMK